MGISSPFPAQLLTDENLPDRTANVDLVTANDMNLVRAALRDMSACLGINPHGSAADLKSRLDASLKDNGFIKTPGNIIVVAKSNAEFSSIQEAIDSITDASSTNTYTILIAPGTYNENITLKSGINLLGMAPTHNGPITLNYQMPRLHKESGSIITVPEEAICCIESLFLHGTSNSLVTLTNEATLYLTGCCLRNNGLGVNTIHFNGQAELYVKNCSVNASSHLYNIIGCEPTQTNPAVISINNSYLNGSIVWSGIGASDPTIMLVDSYMNGKIFSTSFVNHVKLLRSEICATDSSPIQINPMTEAEVIAAYSTLYTNGSLASIDRVGFFGTISVNSCFMTLKTAYSTACTEVLSTTNNIINSNMAMPGWYRA